MGFWIFSLQDRNLGKFYEEHKDGSSLYYNVFLESIADDTPDYVVKEMHLNVNQLLFIKGYLIPIYNRLNIGGYAIIMRRDFYQLYDNKAVLNYTSVFGNIVDLDLANEQQRKCFNLCYEEYCSDYDEFQTQSIRNLMLNAILLSDMMNSKIGLKTGHLLNIVFQFMSLVNEHAVTERRKTFYTERLAVTNILLDTALRVIFDKTFREVVNNIIVKNSLYMIAFTNLSINQIAHDFNYDTSDFNRMFIKCSGYSPKEYRERMLKVIDYVKNIY